MNCRNIVLNYIQNCEKNEPIFIEDIKEYIMQFYKEEEKEKIFNNVKEIINRLNNGKSIAKYMDATRIIRSLLK